MLSTSLTRSFLRARHLFSSYANPIARPFCTRGVNGSGETGDGRDDAHDDKEDDNEDLLSPKNTSHLNSGEVARMRVVHGLVSEHVHAREQGRPPPDTSSNPLIDPRSFDLRGLPEIDGAVLSSFRSEVSGDVADTGRPVSTVGVWDGIESELETPDETWDMVDSKTMGGPRRGSSVIPREASTQIGPRRKREEGLIGVDVDYRAVGLLSTYLTDNGKIIPRRRSKLTRKAQWRVAKAVKTARQMALLHPEPKPTLDFGETIEMEMETGRSEGRKTERATSSEA